ncbi:MAG: hypothetical protein HGA57_05140 [Chlorobium limicola]|uniref:Uncharacterized protein n=1 Tax=Chlorobium limicola (strain DSM 245 / NBRC 103803 / 6330) TaxID=290315 RepID=B3EFL7_CHLL2|nr:hypothetical protein Clim_1947 [Chlorobium limicola DSM 245]NTV20759.1 hypothetical protein [Chlorobium limicola]
MCYIPGVAAVIDLFGISGNCMVSFGKRTYDKTFGTVRYRRLQLVFSRFRPFFRNGWGSLVPSGHVCCRVARHAGGTASFDWAAGSALFFTVERKPLISAAVLAGVSVWVLFGAALAVYSPKRPGLYHALVLVIEIVWFIDVMMFMYGACG